MVSLLNFEKVHLGECLFYLLNFWVEGYAGAARFTVEIEDKRVP
jgi:hypothetical protein